MEDSSEINSRGFKSRNVHLEFLVKAHVKAKAEVSITLVPSTKTQYDFFHWFLDYCIK